MTHRTKPYSLKYVTRQLKKQGWENYNQHKDKNIYWFYFRDREFDPGLNGVILEIRTDRFYVYLTIRHKDPSCLHHKYVHELRDQQDIDDLPTIAKQLRKLQEFDFGGFPQDYRKKMERVNL